MEKYRVGVIGATGMVGQRFVSLLARHPWFTLTAVAASARSAGKTYEEAIGARWALEEPMPEAAKGMVVYNAEADIEAIAAQVDFVFSAVDMKKEEIQALEEAYAKHECPVVSNNSAHRWTADVPMVVPEINPEHLAVIADQRRHSICGKYPLGIHWEDAESEHAKKRMDLLHESSLLRRSSPAFTQGNTLYLFSGNPRIIAFERRFNNEAFLVLVNVSRETAEGTLPLDARLLTPLLRNGEITEENACILPCGGYLVFRVNKLQQC